MLIDFSKEKFDVIIQAGQSNAEGCGIGPVSAADWPLPEFRGRVWHLERDGGRYYVVPAREAVVGGNQIVGNFALPFAARYLEKHLAPDRKILIVRAAVGGTGFVDKQWKIGEDLFEYMMDMTRTALALNAENRAAALLWHQGEYEASGGTPGDFYYGQISALTSAVRKEFGKDLPFIAGDFVEAWRKEKVAGRDENCAAIADALRRLCAEIPNARFVETDGLSSNNEVVGNNDIIHFSRQALYTLGNKYFDAFNIIGEKR